MIEIYSELFANPAMKGAFTVMLYVLPPLIVVWLFVMWFNLWISYKRREWINAQGSVLLEIRLPREMTKSPAAMEVFLNYLHQPGVGTVLDVYLKGRVRPWFSLELVSNEGTVHFYLWMFKGFKNLIESQLYAQFPNIEIHEVPDYALGFHHKDYKIGSIGNFALVKKDIYPIKTYIDYGLEKDPDEEFKIDPIVPVLEFLGSLKKGEHAWIQILLQGHTKEGLKYGKLTEKPDWTKGVQEEIEKILKEARLKKQEKDAKEIPDPKFLSDVQKDTIKAIERNTTKTPFDAMVRGTYFAEKDAFNGANIGGLLSVLKQFSSGNLNGFKPGARAGSRYDYPWQDFRGKKKMKEEIEFFEAFKRRAFFNKHFSHNQNESPYVLTTEEVATLYHFPGDVAATPTLIRIPSKRAEAPANLPM